MKIVHSREADYLMYVVICIFLFQVKVEVASKLEQIRVYFNLLYL